MSERGAGLPRWSLSPVEVTARFGDSPNGAADWFGPSKPQAPGAPADVAGRQWDFPSGYNLNLRARSFEAVSFADLRALADAYDLLRLVIETRKDQIERMNWSIRAKSGATADPARISRVEKFFERPDGAHDWSAWMRIILEDLFVIDAPALWCERDRTGALLALHPLDGATIKPVLDAWGRTPRPFAQAGKLVYPVAYQQVLKGLPAVDYSVRDVLYRPRNLRSHRAYGYSPVEQVIATVNIGMKRQLHQLSYYSEGNIPESLIGVPDAWTPDQIKNFQDYWDLYFTGDLARRRRAKFVPGGVARTFIQTKEPELKNAFDEWIARVVCFAFSVSPQPFINQMNRATSETQKDMADQEGLLPILGWIKRLCDHVIVMLGGEGLEFVWNIESVIDPTVQRENLVAYVGAGMMTRRRAAEILGEILPEDPMADVLTMTTGQGVVRLGPALNSPSDHSLYTDEPAMGKFEIQPRDENGRWIASRAAEENQKKTVAETRHKIAEVALRNLHENPYAWMDTAVRGNFDGTKNKCNLFVYETLAAAGADPGLPHQSTLNTLTGGALGNSYPPTAGDWANTSFDIGGWRVLGADEQPAPGDVVAQKIAYGDASGHVMIVGPENTFIGTGDQNGPHGSLEQIPRRDYIGGLDGERIELPHGPLVYRRWVGK